MARKPREPKSIAVEALRHDSAARRNIPTMELQSFVGEDEASPGEGRIAYTSPMARALLGRAVGELVEIPGGEAEIVALETIRPEG